MDPTIGIRDFLEFVVAGIVRQPADASISREEAEGKTEFVIRLADDDVPRLLGRNGRGIGAIRNLAQAAGALHHLQIGVRVDDPNGAAQRPRSRPQSQNRRQRRR